jgi:hypothetical protein
LHKIFIHQIANRAHYLNRLAMYVVCVGSILISIKKNLAKMMREGEREGNRVFLYKFLYTKSQTELTILTG